MKPLITSFICLLFNITNTTAQCNNGQKIQSPVAQKPTEPGAASLSCNTLLIKWKGHPNQVYEITVTVKDAETNKEIRTFTTKNFQANGSNYTSTIPNWRKIEAWALCFASCANDLKQNIF